MPCRAARRASMITVAPAPAPTDDARLSFSLRRSHQCPHTHTHAPRQHHRNRDFDVRHILRCINVRRWHRRKLLIRHDAITVQGAGRGSRTSSPRGTRRLSGCACTRTRTRRTSTAAAPATTATSSSKPTGGSKRRTTVRSGSDVGDPGYSPSGTSSYIWVPAAHAEWRQERPRLPGLRRFALGHGANLAPIYQNTASRWHALVTSSSES